MFCPNCGNEIDNNAAFCNNCGTKIDAQVTPENTAPIGVDTNATPDVPPVPPMNEPVNNAQQPFNQPNNAANQQPNNPYHQPQQMNYNAPQQAPQTPATYPGKGMGIAGMVLGIVSIVLFCAWYLSIPCGIVGLILSIIANNKAKVVGVKNSLALAGIICSAIGLAVCAIVSIFTVIFLGFASRIAPNTISELDISSIIESF